MLLAGQVQRGNGTDGAPQGDGISVHVPWEATWEGARAPKGKAAPPRRLQPEALLSDVVCGLYTDSLEPGGSNSAPVHWASAVRPTHSPPRHLDLCTWL